MKHNLHSLIVVARNPNISPQTIILSVCSCGNTFIPTATAHYPLVSALCPLTPFTPTTSIPPLPLPAPDSLHRATCTCGTDLLWWFKIPVRVYIHYTSPTGPRCHAPAALDLLAKLYQEVSL